MLRVIRQLPSRLCVSIPGQRWSSSSSGLRRSALFMPASNTRAMEKAKDLPADVLIFDLEDAVAPDAKEQARELAVAAANSNSYGDRELVIRVNGIGTQWFEADVAAAASSNASALLLPKAESAADVHAVEQLAVDAGASAAKQIWCMLETPLGILRAAEIATASLRMSCVLVGTVDLANELRCSAAAQNRWPMMHALQQCILAARAAGITAMDGVFTDLRNDAGFEESCWQGRELGFDGKQLIHPRTIETANAVFAPTEDEVAHARAVIAAHRDAAQRGAGVAVLNGKLVEALHVRGAERMLAMHEKCGGGL